MSKPDKTTARVEMRDLADAPPPPLVEPALRAIRFREPVTLGGVTPETGIIVGERGTEALVVGASVFVRRDQGEVVEVPRAACTLRWRVPVGMRLADVVACVTGRAVP